MEILPILEVRPLTFEHNPSIIDVLLEAKGTRDAN